MKYAAAIVIFYVSERIQLHACRVLQCFLTSRDQAMPIIRTHTLSQLL